MVQIKKYILWESHIILMKATQNRLAILTGYMLLHKRHLKLLKAEQKGISLHIYQEINHSYSTTRRYPVSLSLCHNDHERKSGKKYKV